MCPSRPKAPAPPPPPPEPPTEVDAGVRRARGLERRRAAARYGGGTLLTGSLGVTATPNLARKTALGE